MKTYRIASALLLVLALLLSLGALSVSAAGPTNMDPLNAPFMDNQPHRLDTNADTWFRFIYSGTDSNAHPVSTIRLVNGNNSGVSFEIFAPENINNWWDNKPIGKGTAQNVSCDTGELAGNGACQTNDLFWSGAFGAPGTYYVHLINGNNNPATAQLLIAGDGVSLIPQAAPSQNVPAQAPPLSATTNMDDPGRAVAITGKQQTMAANSVMWFRFDYNGNGDTPHTPVSIRLVNGNNSGVHFDIYSPENLNNWWDNTPTGKGTAQSVNCDTGVVTGSGACQTNDLSWTGSFGAAGTYYVRVKNDNNNPVNIMLVMQ